MTGDPVLIVGAGPTGLLLALRLSFHGIPVRIIDKNPGPGLASRAMVVQARTLELYDQLALADKIVSLGIIVDAIHLRKDQRDVALLEFRNFGGEISPFPFALALPQDDHERFLVEELSARGVNVEWNTSLLGLNQEKDQVAATLQKGTKKQASHFQYVCGCDGAHSKTRELLGLAFDGGTYKDTFYVADVKLVRKSGYKAQASLGDQGFALQFPIRSSGMDRLIGVVPKVAANIEKPTFADMQGIPEKLLNVEVAEVNWFSTYHVHHRVAAKFNVGRVFLLGDAGHIHSPAGGQGLNTGLGDAVNLSWKLASVLQGRASVAVLDSYEPERLAFARTLVETTDRAFSVLVSGGLQSRLLRNIVIPYFLPTALKFDFVRHLAFRTISQTSISYRESPISKGETGSLKAGDRLPYVKALDNFKPLRSLKWQLHVYGDVAPETSAFCKNLGLTVQTFPSTAATSAANLIAGAAYLIRPDGYIGFESPQQEIAALRDYIASNGLTFS